MFGWEAEESNLVDRFIRTAVKPSTTLPREDVRRWARRESNSHRYRLKAGCIPICHEPVIGIRGLGFQRTAIVTLRIHGCRETNATSNSSGRSRTFVAAVSERSLKPLDDRALLIEKTKAPTGRFERPPRGLEARCSPRSTSVVKSGQQDLNLRSPGPKPGALARLRHTPFH